MKFQVFWIRFIFDFKIVFMWNFFKIAPIRERLSPELLQKQDFLKNNYYHSWPCGKKHGFRGANCYNVILELRSEQPSPAWELRWRSPLRTASYDGVLYGLRAMLEPPPRKWSSGEELLRRSSSMLEQNAPREIKLLRKIQRQGAPGLAPFLKSSLWNWHTNLK
jgi:hypothetical protein